MDGRGDGGLFCGSSAKKSTFCIWSGTLDSSLNAFDSYSADREIEDSYSVTQDAQLDDPKSNELSTEFVGRWTTLISTTNWEKGKIILEWRAALEGSEAPAGAYSDETWSQRVGGVTPQHVGRLRRVYERFGATHQTYTRLYWSHFLTALDWDDAEMWLEGATQSSWSISKMRQMRWEANGGDPAQTPPPTETIGSADDEDFAPLAEVDERTGRDDSPRNVSEGPRYDEPDFGDEDQGNPSMSGDDDELAWEDPNSNVPAESPFARLPSLPVDMAEALEQFKLSIIRHRADGWAEVSQADIVKALEALKNFAMQ